MNYNFRDMRENLIGEDNIELDGDNQTPMESVFINDDNGVGNQVAKQLVAQVTRMSSSIKDEDKYTTLRNDLETHILDKY